jgi:type II secretory pathway pseudopilin PulG
MDAEDPALPPDPELLNRQPKWFKPVFYGCIVASILFALAVLTAPVVLRSRKKSPQTEATSNVRQIGLALFEFETEYGTFPNAETAKVVTTIYPSHGLDLSGKSSNALFRQLFAANITQSEAMFYAKVKGSRKPDGDISPSNALERGEVGFGIIAGLSTAGDPARPTVFCPIIPGTDRFDPKPFDGKAVILRVDNSVTSMTIDKSGHVIFEGENILSPIHPIWKGKAPDIRYPE